MSSAAIQHQSAVTDLSRRVLKACAHARTTREYSRELVRQTVSISASQFCFWLAADGTKIYPRCGTLSAERYLAAVLSYCRSAPLIANDADPASGIHSIVVAPMLFGSQCGGFLAMGNRSGGYVPEDLEALNQLGKVALARYESLRWAEELGLGQPPDGTTAVMAHLVHELRQPLSLIDTCAYYLGMILPPAEIKAHGQLEEMRRQVDQANRILVKGMEKLQRVHLLESQEEQVEESRSSTKSAMASVT